MSTDLYGGGTFDTTGGNPGPLAQSDGSMNKSFLLTDYSEAYTSYGSPVGQSAPLARGWSWNFDGTSIQGLDLGYSKSDIVQEFNQTLWQATGLARLLSVTTRSYSASPVPRMPAGPTTIRSRAKTTVSTAASR